MNLPVGPLAGLGQRFDEIMPIHIIQKNGFLSITPAHDVIHSARIFNTSLAWHGLTLCQRPAPVNHKYMV